MEKTSTVIFSSKPNWFISIQSIDFFYVSRAHHPAIRPCPSAYSSWCDLLKLNTDTDTDTETDTDTDIDLEFVVISEEELEKPYRVIIHNDNITTFEFVINILVTVFQVTFARATRIAYEAHSAGNSYVCTLPLEEAKSKVFKAQYTARQQGFPLTFTIEPE